MTSLLKMLIFVALYGMVICIAVYNASILKKLGFFNL